MSPAAPDPAAWCTCVSQQGYVYSENWATYVHSACGKPSKAVHDAVTTTRG